MLKKFFSVRITLTILLILSICFAGYSMYYKVVHWGFKFKPNDMVDVWTIEAHVAFEPTGEPIKMSLAIPDGNEKFKILDETVVADGYKIRKNRKDTCNIKLSSAAKNDIQNIYYRIMLYDNSNGKGKTKAPAPRAPQKPFFEEQKASIAKEIIKIAKTQEGDEVQQIIRVLNQVPATSAVTDFLPVKKTKKDLLAAEMSLLSLKKIPNRAIRGVKLEEERKSFAPDLMLEAYVNGNWRVYDIKNADKGVPSNFVIFQRGGDSLLDIEGGENSSVKFSVIKSINSSFKMTSHRAEQAKGKMWFDYSIYNLPLLQQNILKWLMIFPLAIFVVVVMRNVVGLKTMGTFTPMLLAMALVKSGLWQGLVCFGVIVGLGLVIRALLSRFNLLLVPRISAVVIFVILIMQLMAVTGHHLNIEAALSAAFFPIIITAWIIERASITWEEDGALNAGKEIIYSLIVALITYGIISNEYVRHVMFAFNELNLVILFVVMLLGTYTGYRLTELVRFMPLAKKKG